MCKHQNNVTAVHTKPVMTSDQKYDKYVYLSLNLSLFQPMLNIYTLKHQNFYIKIYNNCSYMFRFRLKPSSGSS
jgi:hypothetical protein